MRILMITTTLIVMSTVPLFAQSLSLSPESSTPTETPFEVKLNVDPLGALVQGMDIEIGFDPAIVSLLSIEAGGWFLTSGYPHYFYDYTTPGCASIRFSGALLGGGSEVPGTAAILHFQALGAGNCPLVFTLFDVRDTGNIPLEVTHSVGDRIIIEQEIGNSRTDLGRIKSIYR